MGGALYQQAGLIEVPSVHALLDACRVLADQPVMRGPTVAIVSNSPSPSTLAGAAIEAHGMEAVHTGLPLDWRADPDDFERSIRTALADDDTAAVLAVFAPPIPSAEVTMAAAIDAAARGATKPVVAVMIGSRDGPVVPGSPVPAFTFPEQAAAALGASHAYGRWLDEEAGAPPAPHRPVDPARAASIIDDALAHGAAGEPVALDVDVASELLAAYGIEIARAAPATPATAVETADRVGYPVALKAVKRRPGRSTRSGVALDLNEGEAVRAAVEIMQEALGADAEALVVQEMTTPGITVRIRCTRDDRLGAIIAVGYGGIDADLIDDHSDRLAPLSPSGAAAMLTETRVGAAINEAGFDPSLLVDTVVQVSQLSADHNDIDELDLNPVIVSEHGAVVTDVAIRLLERPDEDEPIRRLV